MTGAGKVSLFGAGEDLGKGRVQTKGSKQSQACIFFHSFHISHEDLKRLQETL